MCEGILCAREHPICNSWAGSSPPSADVNVAAEVAAGLSHLPTGAAIRPGQRIAISAGSRGVAEVVSSMNVVAVAESAFGGPVWVSRDLAEADGVLVVNRVKPHTDFHGEVESGLVKMLVIGAGKHAGALAALPVVAGIAVVEDQRERTARVEVVAPEAFFTREAKLLETARRLLPRLPFDELDVLVVDELGKDVSGTGMDTNVIGRMSFWGGGEPPSRPRITRILVRGLRSAPGRGAGRRGVRPAGPLFPLPYDENGDLRSPFSRCICPPLG